MRTRSIAAVCLCVALAACAGDQSALEPRGPVAESLASMWWVLFWGAAAILVLVMGLVFYAMFRDPGRRPRLAPVPFLIGAGLVFPAAVLTALLVYSTYIGREITRPAEDPLRIEVTGHQWWWEFRYLEDGTGPATRTANELRLPVGRPVEFVLHSNDVIHSFWIPNLGGKVDMIPGRVNVLRLTAGEPGRYRAQCAEFCGAQHARMGFVVVAEPEAEFEAWRRRLAAPTTVEGPGLDAFLAQGCGTCHAIAGSPATGEGGPVLTRFGERPTLGAGTAANTPRSLRAWLPDHGRTLKPGSHGPDPRELDGDAVEAIARFLEQL